MERIYIYYKINNSMVLHCIKIWKCNYTEFVMDMISKHHKVDIVYISNKEIKPIVKNYL